MPPIRSARTRKAPPDGFDDIEDTLLEFSNKMKDAENASHEGKKRHEVLWPIFQISHQRSRYIYDLYYEKEAISKKLYDWLLKNGYADANLIAKWKKQGYEKVRLGTGVLTRFEGIKLTLYSCVVYDAFRPKKPISTLLVYVVFRRRS
ncbi:pre-mRNA-splicing factor [Trichophyton mentagrophytes]|uniref:Cell cycle control protein cwf14 n=2 Tax=Trichophyton interdigitale TaxID=101480 RepID=A0A9P4YH69_9EURO|nr:Cell cycle control protein cwf14 [Trichophyton interdigitale]KAF3896531.1 Cell cycle control protein cwf14 [Trichophyton interdigitale]KAG8206059.1 Cell cycle control protein cwf14 [Trichophyton interdigitale]KDB24869.1 cell cycle control protein cwf14 [Trichophyton interdigitale MR816]GBF64808.1 pre-mRNA-splicing factor [Trichophyton mentagrophytes]